MNHAVSQLRACTDVAAVETQLLAICAEFGQVDQLHILTARHRGEKQALCFLHMDSELAENRLMAALGARRFDGRLVVVVRLWLPEQQVQWHRDHVLGNPRAYLGDSARTLRLPRAQPLATRVPVHG